jgi:hypothetical protein
VLATETNGRTPIGTSQARVSILPAIEGRATIETSRSGNATAKMFPEIHVPHRGAADSQATRFQPRKTLLTRTSAQKTKGDLQNTVSFASGLIP